MAYDFQTGTNGLRAEVIDSLVKQTAERTYKMKQACAINPTSSWTETFFREDPTVLTGQSGNSFREIPIGANFPQKTLSFERAQARIIKFGAEENIPWESILASQINVQARTVIRLTEGVVKAVDDYLVQKLCNDFFNNDLVAYNTQDLIIQSYAIVAATTGRWNESSAAIFNDVGTAKRFIGDKNYSTDDLLCFVSTRDAQSIVQYMINKGTQFPSIAADAVRNGAIGTINKITFIETMSMPSSYALLVKPKTCATYNELVSLRSTTVEDPFKSTKVRITEEGSLELTDPKAIVLIKGTQGGIGL